MIGGYIMRKRILSKIVAMVLMLILGCTPVMANTSTQTLPNSVLYYGKVDKIVQDKNMIKSINLSSEKYGEIIMNVSEETYWIDDGSKVASVPSTLKEGEGIYIFRSVLINETLPPQSEAYAIIRNTPQDVSCGKYMIIDKITPFNDKVKITANNGNSEFYVDKNTNYHTYLTENTTKQNDLYEGAKIMVWSAYSSETKNNLASDVMLLSGIPHPITRGQFVQMLYEKAGSPKVSSSAEFKDVPNDIDIYPAVVWAKEKKIAVGYDNSTFGVNDILNREQMAVMLWRYAGSPKLMDYTELSSYSDSSKISSFAYQSMAWAHQKGLIVTPMSEPLFPQGNVNISEAERMVKALA